VSTPRGAILLAAVLTVAVSGVAVAAPSSFVRTSEDPGGGIQWRKRLTSDLVDAGYVGDTVLLLRLGTDAYVLEAFSADREGRLMWSREAASMALAGLGDGAVVVAGRPDGSGFDALDPKSGTPVWSSADAYVAWTYLDSVMTVSCPQAEDAMSTCTLARHRQPDSPGTAWPEAWRVSIPPAEDPAPRQLRPLSTGAFDPGTWESGWTPRYVGMETAQWFTVLDGETGALVRRLPHSPDTQVVVAGDRLVFAKVTWRDGTCGYEVWAEDLAGRAGSRPREVWRKTGGFDFRTAEAQWGCRYPDGLTGGDAIRARWLDGRELLVSAMDGGAVWLGDPHDELLATDGHLAVTVGREDRRLLKVVDVDGRVTSRRELPAEPRAAAVADDVVIVGGDGWVQVGVGETVWSLDEEYALMFVSDRGMVLSQPDGDVAFVAI
jgi:hypothetical protein